MAQGRLEIETAWRKHSRVINRMREQSPKRSGWHNQGRGPAFAEVTAWRAVVSYPVNHKKQVAESCRKRCAIRRRVNCLNAFLIFKGALFVMVSQAPTGFDAKKWPAVGP